MPAKNILKPYVEGGYYHIYNRGVEKRVIFEDKQDYKVFLSYLKTYLSQPPDPKYNLKLFTVRQTVFKGVPRQLRNFHGDVSLLVYCLMPNHFHLLIHQRTASAIENFMRSLATRYTMYFNKRYKRVGSLFQDTYKAVLIMEEPYLLHLSRYIHLNPVEHTKNISQAYSSYGDYLGLRETSWVKPKLILGFFSQATLLGIKSVNTYQDFVEKYLADSNEVLGDLTLEKD